MERLTIHLPDEQMGVYDPARDSTDKVNQRIAAKDTKLLAFFELNQTDLRAHNLLYSNIPNHYCWIPRVASQNIQHNGDSMQGIPQQLAGCTLFHQLRMNPLFLQ